MSCCVRMTAGDFRASSCVSPDGSGGMTAGSRSVVFLPVWARPVRDQQVADLFEKAQSGSRKGAELAQELFKARL
jgi:hypothetical protein